MAARRTVSGHCGETLGPQGLTVPPQEQEHVADRQAPAHERRAQEGEAGIGLAGRRLQLAEAERAAHGAQDRRHPCRGARELARPAARVASILRAVGGPLSFGELEPPASEADARFAFLSAPLMRRRLTIGDVLLFLGWDREALWAECLSAMT